MEKTRVEDGQLFWYVRFYNWGLTVDSITDCGCNDMWAKGFFKAGNYYHTEAEARAVVEKLKAVFKGADVIVMPSREESLRKSKEIARKYDAPEVCIPAMDMVDWFESKIVK